MSPRQHVPFDTFAMKVDVPVSMFVRDGGVGWSCGQCPLDGQSRVQSPNDPVAQALHVCDMIQQTVARTQFAPGDIAKLHVYFVPTSPTVDAGVLAVFRARFPKPVIIVPITVPHFYYDGMLIEVDVFAGTGLEARPAVGETGVALEIVEGPELIWATARRDGASNAAVRDGIHAIGRALTAQGLTSTHLLSDHWFVPAPSLAGAQPWESDFVTMPDALVSLAAQESPRVLGTFVFSREPIVLRTIDIPETKVTVVRRQSRRFTWCVATCRDDTLGLVGQTAPLMEGIKTALSEGGMTFRNVTKLTAHYVGGTTDDELHGNMQIRHSYYPIPGPASTGLPVEGLLVRHCQLSVDVVGAF